LTITGATLTANAPILDLTQTWNNAAVTFTGAKLNITDTASNAASLLMDLQVGLVSQFSVRKNGLTRVGSFYAGGGIFGANGSTGVTSLYNTGQFGWTNAGSAETGIDTILTRRGAANLRLGAADAAGSAIAVNSVASNQLTLASNHGLTNGAAVQVTFTAGGAVPAGTAVNTTYYARSISAAVLELYGTFDQATAASGTTGIIAVTTAGTTAFINRAAPFQTLSVQSFTGTDIPGQPFVITGSQGTGTGAGGDIIFRVAPRGTTGSTANALSTALTIDSTRNSTFSTSIRVASGNIYGLGGVASGAYLNLGATNNNNAGFGIGSDIRWHFSTNQSGPANNGFFQASTHALGWTSSSSATATCDLALFRDAANTLALRNATNAQEFRVYETTTGTIYKAILGNRQLMKIAGAAFDNGAGANAGTLTNSPVTGNPTKWIPIDDNGTTRYIPAW
jgi:hypothetical protein